MREEWRQKQRQEYIEKCCREQYRELVRRISHGLYNERLRNNTSGSAEGDWQAAEQQAQPSLKTIRRDCKIAYQLYRNRVIRGEDGDEQTDWQKAQNIGRTWWKRIPFQTALLWQRGIFWFERTWVEAGLEGFAKHLENLAIIEIASLATNAAVISTLALYALGSSEREKQKHYQAWDVINSATGKTTEAGRRSALEDLWSDDVSLVGLDINGASIASMDLPLHCRWNTIRISNIFCELSTDFFTYYGADLRRSNLNDLELFQVNLPGITLQDSVPESEEAGLAGLKLEGLNWFEVSLPFSTIIGVYIESANLNSINLDDSNLEALQLNNVNLEQVSLRSSNLKLAQFQNTSLENVDLSNANLEGAILEVVTLKKVKLRSANLKGTVFLNVDFGGMTIDKETLEESLVCEITLPRGVDIDPDRDCDKIIDDGQRTKILSL